jgi:hypothetical protein
MNTSMVVRVRTSFRQGTKQCGLVAARRATPPDYVYSIQNTCQEARAFIAEDRKASADELLTHDKPLTRRTYGIFHRPSRSAADAFTDIGKCFSSVHFVRAELPSWMARAHHRPPRDRGTAALNPSG